MWQKATKNGRKQIKMIGKLAKCCVFQIIHCQDFFFCPAKLLYLSCQASISVLPSTHFFPAKLTNFSRGGPPPSYAHGCVQELVTILGPQFKTTLRDASVVYNWKTGQPQLASYLVTCQILQHRINFDPEKSKSTLFFIAAIGYRLSFVCKKYFKQYLFIYFYIFLF